MSQRTRRWRARSNRGRSRRVLVEVVIVGAQRLPSGRARSSSVGLFWLAQNQLSHSPTAIPSQKVVPLVHQICSFPPPPAALHFVPSASLNSRTSTGPVHLGQLQVGFERGKPPAPNTPKTNTPLPTPTPHASTRPPAPLPYYCTSRVCFRLVRPPPPSSPLLAAGPGRWLAPPFIHSTPSYSRR